MVIIWNELTKKKTPCSPFIIGVCTSYKAIAIVWKSNWKIFGLFLGFLSSIVYVQRFIVVFRHQFVRKNIPALVDQFLLKPIVGKKTYQKKIPCVIILNVKKNLVKTDWNSQVFYYAYYSNFDSKLSPMYMIVTNWEWWTFCMD